SVIDADSPGLGGLDPAILDLTRGEDGLLYIKWPDGFLRLRGLEVEPVSTAPKIAWQSGTPGPQSGRGTLPDGSHVEITDADSIEFRTVRVTPAAGSAAPARDLRLDWVAE